MQSDASQPDAPIARLDNQSMTPFHRKLLVTAGIGWMFDAMDILIAGSVVAAIAGAWQLSPQTSGLILSANLAGMFVGAAVAGSLADRFGRKGVFQATLLAYSILTGLSALAWSAVSMGFIRFLAGVGMGGELPVASTLVSEFAPARERGHMLVLLESFWAYGSVLAALIGYLFIPAFGWQAAFLVGAIPALYVFILRRAIPESPRYLLSKGKTAEAEAVLRQMEATPAGTTHTNKQSADKAAGGSPAAGKTLGARLADLFAPALARRTVMLWVLWFAMVFSYYGIFTWMPGLLRGKGFSLQQAFLLNLIISLFQIPGYFSAAFLVERWGRKPTLVTFLLLNAVGAFFFAEQSLSVRPDVAQILIWGAVMAFFNLGAWGIVYTYTPELYPTRLRGTGTGFAAAAGRFGGVLGPYAVGAMLVAYAGSQYAVFITFTVILVIGGLTVLVLGEETKGRTLEEISGS
jgi:MFS transporter, putative metabolite:H+ symporter